MKRKKEILKHIEGLKHLVEDDRDVIYILSKLRVLVTLVNKNETKFVQPK